MKLIECVPNISEGKDKEKIDLIVNSINNSSKDIKVLDVDSGYHANRTVITFVGPPEAIIKGAFECIRQSYELIDMNKHIGEHPRLGCTDVCPFVPLYNSSMEDCIEIAKKLGEIVNRKLEIPVYLYGKASQTKAREDLAFIRKGGYEKIRTKLQYLKPDFGPANFNKTVKKAGAISIGARNFLIAFNINLNTQNKKLANKIASKVRESGRLKKDKNGKKIRIPGKLKAVKAFGWYIEEYNLAQVSTNLTNYKETPLYKLFEVCCKEAEKLGLKVTGSELVGLAPKEALIETGKYFKEKKLGNSGYSEKQLIEIAVSELNLDELRIFNPEEKIVEYKIKQ